MKIINFGSCNIDHVYSLQHIVSPGETVSAEGLTEHSGGKGLNQSIAAAVAGGDVYHIGNIGKDGLFLKDLLDKSGVNTRLLNVDDERTGHAIIQLDESGENCIIVCQGANGLITEKQIDNAVNSFCAGDICMLQNEIPKTDYIINAAHKKGMTVIWNPSPFNDKINRESISLCDYVILNSTEGKELAGLDGADEILKQLTADYPNTGFVLTLGSKGSIFGRGESRINQEAFRAKPVDTTGAGDTFAGYFAAALSKGYEIKVAMTYASAAAAIATEALGAANSIPPLEKVQERIKNQKKLIFC